METKTTQKRVLIIDDEMDMRFFLLTLLKKMGHQAIVCKNGQEGLAQIDQTIPDLVILDVMMPQKGGAIVYRELRSNPEWRKIPVIMLSGVDRDAFFHHIRLMDATLDANLKTPEYYLQKPVDPEYLESVIHEIFSRQA